MDRAHRAETRQDLIDRLTAEHRACDARLQQLEHHRWLTPAEQQEATHLKKRKLRAKDGLQRLGQN